MKKIIFFIILMIFSQIKCKAVTSPPSSISEEINEQIVQSDANKIKENLPSHVVDSLIYLNAFDIKSMENLNIYNIINIFLHHIQIKIKKPFFNIILLIIILSILSIVSSFYQNEIVEFIASLFVCINMSSGILDILKSSILSLKFSSNFILCFVPIFLTFALSLGHPFSAHAFNVSLLYCNKLMIDITENFMFSIINFMSGLSIISSISVKLKLQKLFDIFYASIKWILIVFSSVISFAFSIQKIISSSLDNTLTKEIKFAMGLIPIIGSAINDASSVVKASSRILQVNIGIFGILSILFIFLPSIVDCLIWIFAFQICEFTSEMFEFNSLKRLFISFKKVINIILSFIIICFLIFVFSTSSIMKD